MQLSNVNVDLKTIQPNRFSQIKSENIQDKDIKKVADDFEAFFMSQLLDISLKSTKIAGDGVGADIIKGLYTENIAKASAGSLGISDMLYQFLSENKVK